MKEWIDLIVAICGAISVIVPLTIKYVKAIKTIIKEKNYSKLLVVMKDAAVEAEKLYKDGAEKRAYVLNLVKVSCESLGIEYEEDRFDAELTRFIAATKEINK